MFEKGNLMTLSDNNEYIIVDKFIDNGTVYLYLVDINNNTNIIYGKLENDEVVELSDEEELTRVIKIVSDNLHKPE